MDLIWYIYFAIRFNYQIILRYIYHMVESAEVICCWKKIKMDIKVIFGNNFFNIRQTNVPCWRYTTTTKWIISESMAYSGNLEIKPGIAFLYPSISYVLITVYPKKYAHGFVVLCFVVVMQSFIMNSHEVFIHIHQGCFTGTGAIVRLPQCQWSKHDGYGKISQCTTTKHSKAKTVCIFLGIYCMLV